MPADGTHVPLLDNRAYLCYIGPKFVPYNLTDGNYAESSEVRSLPRKEDMMTNSNNISKSFYFSVNTTGEEVKITCTHAARRRNPLLQWIPIEAHDHVLLFTQLTFIDVGNGNLVAAVKKGVLAKPTNGDGSADGKTLTYLTYRLPEDKGGKNKAFARALTREETQGYVALLKELGLPAMSDLVVDSVTLTIKERQAKRNNGKAQATSKLVVKGAQTAPTHEVSHMDGYGRDRNDDISPNTSEVTIDRIWTEEELHEFFGHPTDCITVDEAPALSPASVEKAMKAVPSAKRHGNNGRGRNKTAKYATSTEGLLEAATGGMMGHSADDSADVSDEPKFQESTSDFATWVSDTLNAAIAREDTERETQSAQSKVTKTTTPVESPAASPQPSLLKGKLTSQPFAMLLGKMSVSS